MIGLVGGVASGKSTVAKLFSEHGIRHVDADHHARAAASEPDAIAAVARSFGPEFVRDEGLDRARLADRIFADAEARRTLEAILHPLVRRRIDAELAEAREAGQSCLLDVPLLFEAGLFERCDTIVFVDAPHEVRAARAAGRGWAPDELGRREASQLPLAEKRARADHTIDNGGSLDATRAAVRSLLRSLEHAA